MSVREEFWTEVLVCPETVIDKVLQVLNQNPLKIILVVDDKRTLIGTVTDGDVRRGLLNGVTISDPVRLIMNIEPKVVGQNISRENALEIMKLYRVEHIPILNERKQVSGLHVLDSKIVRKDRENMVFVMAGGKGTRLLPKTRDIPKAMLPLAGKPILEHIIARAKEEGFSNFQIAVHHLGHVIEDYFKDGQELGVKISYLRESIPLGTAGALSLLETFPEKAFIVTNGDVISDIRFGYLLDFHHQNEADATMAVQRHEWQNPYGVVATKGFEIISQEEKPVYRWLVNAGVYVLNPTVLSILKKASPIDMPALFDEVRARKLKTFAYPLLENWSDIGSHDDYFKAFESMRLKDV